MTTITIHRLSGLDPEALQTRSTFDCGSEPLNRYLASTASQHEARNITRTFCAIDASGIVGYCSLTNASVHISALSPEVLKRYRLPTHLLPVVRLARLAVDRRHQRRGIGNILLVEAMRKVLSVANESGCVGLVVDAKDAAAAAYYTGFGFRTAPDNPGLLFMPLPEIQALFETPPPP